MRIFHEFVLCFEFIYCADNCQWQYNHMLHAQLPTTQSITPELFCLHWCNQWLRSDLLLHSCQKRQRGEWSYIRMWLSDIHHRVSARNNTPKNSNSQPVVLRNTKYSPDEPQSCNTQVDQLMTTSVYHTFGDNMPLITWVYLPCESSESYWFYCWVT